jgi:hypothetical protein
MRVRPVRTRGDQAGSCAAVPERGTSDELRFTLMAVKDHDSALKGYKAVTASLDKGTARRVKAPKAGAESVAGVVVDGGTGHGTQMFMRVGTAVAGILYGSAGQHDLGSHLLADQARMFAERIAAAEH